MVLALVKEWRDERTARGQSSNSSSIPAGDVLEWTVADLNQWIPLFIHEVRKRDGNNYRAKTLMEYVLTLQSAFVLMKGRGMSFLKDKEFRPIKNALDNRMMALQALGLGHNPNKADIVTVVMEEALWAGGLLCSSPPERLLGTLIYLLGVNLGLRAGEHRKLRREMFRVSLQSNKKISKK